MAIGLLCFCWWCLICLYIPGDIKGSWFVWFVCFWVNGKKMSIESCECSCRDLCGLALLWCPLIIIFSFFLAKICLWIRISFPPVRGCCGSLIKPWFQAQAWWGRTYRVKTLLFQQTLPVNTVLFGSSGSLGWGTKYMSMVLVSSPVFLSPFLPAPSLILPSLPFSFTSFPLFLFPFFQWLFLCDLLFFFFLFFLSFLCGNWSEPKLKWLQSASSLFDKKCFRVTQKTPPPTHTAGHEAEYPKKSGGEWRECRRQGQYVRPVLKEGTRKGGVTGARC